MHDKKIELRIEPWLMVAAVIVTALVVGYLLWGTRPIGQAPSERPGKVWVVKMVTRVYDDRVENVFEPDRLVLAPGDTVRWEVGNGVHNTVAFHPGDEHAAHHDGMGNSDEPPLRIPPEAKPWESEHLRTPGEAFEYIFTVEGVYNYFCHPHLEDGMVGVIVVGSPAPGPGLELPQKELPEKTKVKLDELIAWAKTQKGVR